MLSHLSASPLLQPFCVPRTLPHGLQCRSAKFCRSKLAASLRLRQSVAQRAVTATSMAESAAVAPVPHTPRCSSVKSDLLDLFRTAIKTAYPNEDDQPILAPCNNPKFGDYQCNNAMPLFAKLKGKEGAPKAPRDIGVAISKALPASDLISEVSLAGPGFINVKLSRANLAARIQGMLKAGVTSWAPDLSSQRVIVDLSSPNVAKEMHVGHLRSTIIGDTLARTLEFCGADTLRLNHIGDWGTQFGMLIQHMTEMRPEGLGAEGGKDEDVADLQVGIPTGPAAFQQVAVVCQQCGCHQCVQQCGWQRFVAAMCVPEMCEGSVCRQCYPLLAPNGTPQLPTRAGACLCPGPALRSTLPK
jgi:hypothetical protein